MFYHCIAELQPVAGLIYPALLLVADVHAAV